MPHHTGVLAASILLLVGLGVNMVAFPEVWKMLRNDSASSVALTDNKDVPIAPPISSDSVKQPVSQPTGGEETKKDVTVAKPVSVDKPIPIDQPSPPKKAEPAPKPAPAPETPPKKTEPAPQPKPAPAPETPPKKTEPAPKPKPAPAPEPPPKKVEPAPQPKPAVEEKPSETSVRAAAFAPIVPLELQELEQKESLLPTTEPPEAFSASVRNATQGVAAPAYAQEFKAPESPTPSTRSVTPSRSAPTFETLDSALAAPIVYESRPTIEQRVAESSAPSPVLLPKTSTETAVPISPTGPVKRLPRTN